MRTPGLLPLAKGHGLVDSVPAAVRRLEDLEAIHFRGSAPIRRKVSIPAGEVR